MPPIYEFALWIIGVSAMGSAVGVVIVLIGWCLVARMSASIAAWLDRDEGGDR
jgi:hypothetical protein